VQRGGEDVLRLWAFLALFALVLVGCSAFGDRDRTPTSISHSPSPILSRSADAPPVARSAEQRSSTLEWWAQVGSIAGASTGIVSAVLSGIAVYIAWHQLGGLRADQRRIREDLERRPRILVGFDAPRAPDGVLYIEGTERTVVARFQPGQPFSELITFYLTAINVGTRSAQQLVWNFEFEKTVKIPMSISSGFYERTGIEGAERNVLAILQPYLHVDDVFRPDLFIQVALGVKVIDFSVHIWHSETRKVEITPLRLHVVVEGSDLSD
jgi:hypothetical protein